MSSRWGTPTEYADYFRMTRPLFQAGFLRWLERENPELHKSTLREIASASKRKTGKSETDASPGLPDHGKVDL